MVEPITYQQQRKDFVYVPDDLFSVLFIQKLYDKVYHQEGDAVKQRCKDDETVANDQNEALKALSFVKADNFGNNREYILNHDIDNYDVKKKDLVNLFNKLTKKCRTQAEKRHFCFMIFACHGFSRLSMQSIVLNEFDPKLNFYVLYPAEEKIRTISEATLNCYYIVLFACCRGIWDPIKHTNCVGAKCVEEATVLINQRVEE